jgi:hypothetical protein
MAAKTKRQVIDFLAKDYQTSNPKVQLLSDLTPSSNSQADLGTQCVMRWYLSLQGEDAPFISRMVISPNSSIQQTIYRYDWAFGITLLKGYYWNWQKELRNENSLAIHLVLESKGDSTEAIPVSATMSVLHPSRNTMSFWESALPKIPKAAADVAKAVEDTLPFAKFIESGLALTSNVLESQAENKKNWFIYQFLDERRKCPTIEWRINKNVLEEYGPLLRGSLFLVFGGSASINTNNLRILFRPQVGFYPKDDICFIIPTDELTEDQQVCIDVNPQEQELTDSR